MHHTRIAGIVRARPERHATILTVDGAFDLVSRGGMLQGLHSVSGFSPIRAPILWDTIEVFVGGRWRGDPQHRSRRRRRTRRPHDAVVVLSGYMRHCWQSSVN